MADLSRFENACRAFYAKHLFNPLPLFGKPVVQVRATNNLAMFQSPMPFIPRFCLLPSSRVGRTIFKEISDIFFEGRLVVCGNEEILSLQPLHLRTKLPLSMQSVEAENTPFHGLWR